MTKANAAATAQASTSVRARSGVNKPKSSAGTADPTRRVQFRPVLDNPLTVAWPTPSSFVRKQILDELLKVLKTPQNGEESSILAWRDQQHDLAKRETRRTRRKLARQNQRVNLRVRRRPVDEVEAEEIENLRAKKKQKQAHETESNVERDVAMAKITESDADEGINLNKSCDESEHKILLRSKKTVSIPNWKDLKRSPREKTGGKDSNERATNLRPPAISRPRILDQICVGINQITRTLESEIRWARAELGDPSAVTASAFHERQKRATTKRAKNRRKKRRTLLNSAAQPESTTPEKLAKSAPKQLLPELNLLAPTAETSLNRASYRYLNSALSASLTNASLPKFLLPPTEFDPFFRILADSHAREMRKLFVEQRGDKKRAMRKSARIAIGMRDILINDHHHQQTRLPPKDAAKSTNQELDQPKSVKSFTKVETKPAEKVEGENRADATAADEETKEKTGPTFLPLIDLIFVCKPDLNPPGLVQHLPTMCAAVNATRQAQQQQKQQKATSTDTQEMQVDTAEKAASHLERKVFLIPLDLGAEQILADALGVRRIAAMGLQMMSPGTDKILEIIQQHFQPLSASWLLPHLLNPISPASSATTRTATPSLIPTHIKHLRTTAPLDPKAAVQAKKADKAAKKKLQQDKQKARQQTYRAMEEGED